MDGRWTVRREVDIVRGPRWMPLWIVRSPEGQTYGVFAGTRLGWRLAIEHVNACAATGTC